MTSTLAHRICSALRPALFAATLSTLALGCETGTKGKDAQAAKSAAAGEDACGDCCAVPVAAAAGAGGSATQPAAAAGWRDLFDGKSLKGWKVADFAGHGEPAVEDGVLTLPNGEGLTGVTYAGHRLSRRRTTRCR
jgi:hypothetical protein